MREPEIVGWHSLTEEVLNSIVTAIENRRPTIIHLPSTKGGGGSRIVRDVYREIPVKAGWPPLVHEISQLAELLEIRHEIFPPRRSGLSPESIIWFPIELSEERTFEESVLHILNRYEEELEEAEVSLRTIGANVAGAVNRQGKKYVIDYGAKVAVSAIPLGSVVFAPLLKALPDIKRSFSRKGKIGATAKTISGTISDKVSELLRDYSRKVPVIVVIDSGIVDEQTVSFLHKVLGKSLNKATHMRIVVLITSSDPNNHLDVFTNRELRTIPLLNTEEINALIQQFEDAKVLNVTTKNLNNATPLEVVMKLLDGNQNYYRLELKNYKNVFNVKFYENFVAVAALPEIPTDLWNRAVTDEIKVLTQRSLSDLTWGRHGIGAESGSLVEAGIRSIHRQACRDEIRDLEINSESRERILKIQSQITNAILSEVPEDIGEVFTQVRLMTYCWPDAWPESFARVVSALRLYTDREYLIQACQISASDITESSRNRFVNDVLLAFKEMNSGNVARSIAHLVSALEEVPPFEFTAEAFDFFDLLCALPQQALVGNAQLLEIMVNFWKGDIDFETSVRSRLRSRIVYLLRFALAHADIAESLLIGHSFKSSTELLNELKSDFEKDRNAYTGSDELDNEENVWSESLDLSQVLLLAESRVARAFKVQSNSEILASTEKTTSQGELEKFALRLEEILSSEAFPLMKDAVVESLLVLEGVLNIHQSFLFDLKDNKGANAWKKCTQPEKDLVIRILFAVNQMIVLQSLDQMYLSAADKYILATGALLCDLPDSKSTFLEAHSNFSSQCMVDISGLLTAGTQFLYRNTSGKRDRAIAKACLENLFKNLELETGFLDAGSVRRWVRLAFHRVSSENSVIAEREVLSVLAQWCPNTLSREKSF